MDGSCCSSKLSSCPCPSPTIFCLKQEKGYMTSSRLRCREVHYKESAAALFPKAAECWPNKDGDSLWMNCQLKSLWCLLCNHLQKLPGSRRQGDWMNCFRQYPTYRTPYHKCDLVNRYNYKHESNLIFIAKSWNIILFYQNNTYELLKELASHCNSHFYATVKKLIFFHTC